MPTTTTKPARALRLTGRCSRCTEDTMGTRTVYADGRGLELCPECYRAGEDNGEWEERPAPPRAPRRKKPKPTPLSPELARLERGIFLASKRTGPGRYRVEGSDTIHEVDVTDHQRALCDCEDYHRRRKPCKHIYAALLREDDLQLRRSIRELITALRTPPSTES